MTFRTNSLPVMAHYRTKTSARKYAVLTQDAREALEPKPNTTSTTEGRDRVVGFSSAKDVKTCASNVCPSSLVHLIGEYANDVHSPALSARAKVSRCAAINSACVWRAHCKNCLAAMTLPAWLSNWHSPATVTSATRLRLILAFLHLRIAPYGPSPVASSRPRRRVCLPLSCCLLHRRGMLRQPLQWAAVRSRLADSRKSASWGLCYASTADAA